MAKQHEPGPGGKISFQVTLFAHVQPELFAALCLLPPGEHRVDRARHLMSLGLEYERSRLRGDASRPSSPAPASRPTGAAAIFDPPVDE